MDRAVSLKKFDTAVQLLGADAALYVAGKGWDVVTAAYPTLSVVFRHPRSCRAVEFRFNCDNWDELPPSLTLHDPEDGQELPWEEWPKEAWSVLNRHPSTGKPFLCLPGIREYHTHRSHLGDVWERYRPLSSYSLLGIVDRVQQRFNDSNG